MVMGLETKFYEEQLKELIMFGLEKPIGRNDRHLQASDGLFNRRGRLLHSIVPESRTGTNELKQ